MFIAMLLLNWMIPIMFGAVVLYLFLRLVRASEDIADTLRRIEEQREQP